MLSIPTCASYKSPSSVIVLIPITCCTYDPQFKEKHFSVSHVYIINLVKARVLF